MADKPRRKSDPLAAPKGGWPKRPSGKRAERLVVAKWLWSLPPGDAYRFSIDDPDRVERLLYSLSCWLLDDLRNRDTFPTKREHINRLIEITRTAKKLLAQIKYVSGDKGILRIVAMQSAFFRYEQGRNPSQYELVNWDIVLATPLGVLIRLATEEAEDIATAAPGSGHQRLHDRLFGDPRHSLAIRAAWLVAEFCGTSAVKMTDGGVLHRVINHVWTDATGLDPEDYNLLAFLKKGVRLWRLGEHRPPNLTYKTVLNRSKKRRLQT